MVFVANNKIRGFKRKLIFLKICVYHPELERVPILKVVSNEISRISKCGFFSHCNEMSHLLEEVM